VIDFGCGKSYLTFILYYYLTEIKKLDVLMIGLDLKKEVIEKCNLSARKYGYSQLSFELGDINTYEAPFPVDMIITLHACDTATDYALYHGVKWNARLIFSVPCCQHEANEQMKSDELRLLTKYGIVKERMAALMTDAIRGSLLEVCGYKIQLLEFVDLSHTPKNILIRGKRGALSDRKKQKALQEVEAVMAEFALTPTFYRLLKDDGLLE
jgi:SAM-dependent methyltransferase